MFYGFLCTSLTCTYKTGFPLLRLAKEDNRTPPAPDSVHASLREMSDTPHRSSSGSRSLTFSEQLPITQLQCHSNIYRLQRRVRNGFSPFSVTCTQLYLLYHLAQLKLKMQHIRIFLNTIRLKMDAIGSAFNCVSQKSKRQWKPPTASRCTIFAEFSELTDFAIFRYQQTSL